jgi:hypothetical protein
MKRAILAAIADVAIAGLTAGALAGIPAANGNATGASHDLVIRPEVVGCHSWSLDGGAYTVDQTVRLREGESVAVVNPTSARTRSCRRTGATSR